MAGGGMRVIKRRIKSVNSTKQITKAMEMVASSKLRKGRERMELYRPYFSIVSGIVNDLLGQSTTKNIYVEGSRDIKKTLYIVVAGDKGLCGGFNSNTIKMFTSIEEKNGSQSQIMPIGIKSVDYFTKRDYDVKKAYPGIAETITYQAAKEIADEIRSMYESGEVDEIYMVYTQFVTVLSQQVKKARLLPMSAHEVAENLKKLSEDSESVVGGEENTEIKEITQYSPDPEEFFNLFVPQYIESMLYGGLVESYASEQSARKMAMENATDNANEMIEQLTLFYNRARQAAITSEIIEIVSGADALQ